MSEETPKEAVRKALATGDAGAVMLAVPALLADHDRIESGSALREARQREREARQSAAESAADASLYLRQWWELREALGFTGATDMSDCDGAMAQGAMLRRIGELRAVASPAPLTVLTIEQRLHALETLGCGKCQRGPA